MHEKRPGRPVEHIDRLVDQPSLRLAGGIGQDDDGRFKSLGAMHRHHPHAIAALAQFALDRHFGAPHGGDETLQGGLLALLVLERQFHQLGQHVVDFLAQPAMEGAQAALGIKDMAQKFEGPLEIELLAPARQPGMGVTTGGERSLLQRIPQRLVLAAWLGQGV